MSRFSTIIIVFGLLIAGVLYDRVEQDPNVPVEPTVLIVDTPVLETPAPIGATWFCPVGSSNEGGYASGTVMITNVGTENAVANLEMRTGTGPGASLRFEVAPGGTEIVSLAELGNAEAAAVVVEIIGGQGVVGHRVTTPFGTAEGPCASTSSSTWYLASGATTRDATEVLALLNPFPNDVVFTATFQTPTRSRQPRDLERAVVPARSVRLINVGDFVAREEVVSTTITTGGGQLVVERLQIFDGTLGPVGAALELAVATPSTQWRLPAGRIHEGGDQTITIFNPGNELAEIDVQLDPLNSADRAEFGLVPFEITVPAGRLTTLDLGLIASQISLPLPYEVGITVTSANGVPFVVDRWQLTPGIDRDLIGAGGTSGRRTPGVRFQNDDPSPDEPEVAPLEIPSYAQPTARLGAATSRGTNLLSTRWVTAFTTLLPDNGTAVVVTAPEGALVEVRQLLGGTLGSPIRASIEPRGRVVIPLSNPVEGAPIVVTSDLPIAVEIQIVTADRFDVVPAIPAAGS